MLRGQGAKSAISVNIFCGPCFGSKRCQCLTGESRVSRNPSTVACVVVGRCARFQEDVRPGARWIREWGWAPWARRGDRVLVEPPNHGLIFFGFLFRWNKQIPPNFSGWWCRNWCRHFLHHAMYWKKPNCWENSERSDQTQLVIDLFFPRVLKRTGGMIHRCLQR